MFLTFHSHSDKAHRQAASVCLFLNRIIISDRSQNQQISRTSMTDYKGSILLFHNIEMEIVETMKGILVWDKFRAYSGQHKTVGKKINELALDFVGLKLLRNSFNHH